MRQDLLKRQAVIAINELNDRVPVQKGRDHLKSKGLMPDDEDLVEKGQLEWTREVFREAGHYENLEQTGKFEWAHITVRREDGTKDEYYKKIRQTTVDEAIQDLEYWHKYMRSGANKLRRRYELYCEIHGEDEIQRRLSFGIPAVEPIGA